MGRSHCLKEGPGLKFKANFSYLDSWRSSLGLPYMILFKQMLSANCTVVTLHCSKTATVVHKINRILFIRLHFASHVFSWAHQVLAHARCQVADRRMPFSRQGKLPESMNSLDPGGETCSTGAGDTLSGVRTVTAPPSPLSSTPEVIGLPGVLPPPLWELVALRLIARSDLHLLNLHLPTPSNT